MVFCTEKFREKADIQQHFGNYFALWGNSEGGYAGTDVRSEKKMSLSILIRGD